MYESCAKLLKKLYFHLSLFVLERSKFKLFVYEVVMAEMDDNRLPDELFIGSTFRNDLNCYTVEERLKEMNDIIRIKRRCYNLISTSSGDNSYDSVY